jgi:hypothetical protein
MEYGEIMVKKIIAVVALALTVAGIAGCNKTTSSSVHAAATSTQAAAEKSYATDVLKNAGVPVNGSPAAQLTFAKSMLTKSGRDTLATKLNIPKSNRAAFEDAALGDAEHDHVTSHAGRVQFLGTDLPELVVKYQ